MLRDRIDAYLDGSLDPAGVAELQATLRQDPAADKLLSHMKAERALRAAAYASYQPTAQESAVLAAKMLEDAHYAPVGRIGYWIRHGAAVAAAVIVVAGSFGAGQMMAPTKYITTKQPIENTVYSVVVADAKGEITQSADLRTTEERDVYIRQRFDASHGLTPADLEKPGHM